MFFNKEKKERMEFIRNFTPTSKMHLKQACHWYCNGDIEKAEKMYEYYAKDIELPDFDPTPPTLAQQVKENANGIMNWVKDNQSTLTQGYEFIRQLIANKGKLPALASAEEDVEAAESLPSIN